MKSAIFAAALVGSSVAAAQPHVHAHQHRHEHVKAKRHLVVEYKTVTETATVWVDEYSTVTVQPSKAPEVKPTTTLGAGGEFYQAPSSSSVPAPVVVPSPSSPPPAEYQAPAPSTPPVVEAPKSTYVPPPAAPSSTPSTGTGTGSGTGGGDSGAYDHHGKITYYQVGLGSCGYDDSGADQTKNIVAVSLPYFRSVSDKTSYGLNQPANPLCDKTVTISANGKTVQGVIRDSCPGCLLDSIDVSETIFKQLFGSLDGGKLDVSWKLNA